MLVWYIIAIHLVFKRYGLHGLITGHRARHAAMGRARRGVTRIANSHRDTLYRACDLIERLRAERELVAA